MQPVLEALPERWLGPVFIIAIADVAADAGGEVPIAGKTPFQPRPSRHVPMGRRANAPMEHHFRNCVILAREEDPMGVIQVHMPDHIKEAIDRQIADGRVASEAAFLIEAARRYAEDLEIETVVVAEAQAGIADADAGRLVTISGPEDAEALHQRTMRRLGERLVAERG